MEPNDKKLFELRMLVRLRLERDLNTIATISKERTELSLRDILDELHNVYLHYIQQEALLNNAATYLRMSEDDTTLQDKLRELRSLDN